MPQRRPKGLAAHDHGSGATALEPDRAGDDNPLASLTTPGLAHIAPEGSDVTVPAASAEAPIAAGTMRPAAILGGRDEREESRALGKEGPDRAPRSGNPPEADKVLQGQERERRQPRCIKHGRKKLKPRARGAEMRQREPVRPTALRRHEAISGTITEPLVVRMFLPPCGVQGRNGRKMSKWSQRHLESLSR